MKFTNKCGLTKLIKKKILSQDRVEVDVEDEKRKKVEPSGLANIFKKRTTSQSTINNAFKKKEKDNTDLQVATYFYTNDISFNNCQR